MDCPQLWAFLARLRQAHVPRDARAARGIVDCDQALPLLHGAGLLARDAQALLLHLTCATRRCGVLRQGSVRPALLPLQAIVSNSVYMQEKVNEVLL